MEFFTIAGRVWMKVRPIEAYAPLAFSANLFRASVCVENAHTFIYIYAHNIFSLGKACLVGFERAY